MYPYRSQSMLFVSILAILNSPVFALPHPTTDFFLGGIQVNEPDHEAWITGLQNNGMNTVSATVYARQGDWDTDTIWFDKESPAVIAEIRTAKQRGMKVVLIPRVALDHAFERNRFLWHGMIMPGSDALLKSWFETYSDFVIKWAKIASKLQVDVFAVGSELNALTSTDQLDSIPELAAYYLSDEKRKEQQAEYAPFYAQLKSRLLSTRDGRTYTSLNEYLDARWSALRTWAQSTTCNGASSCVKVVNQRRAALSRYWHQLIAEVRKVFAGKITYAANFDQFHEVDFWSSLDFIGVNAYFPLRQREGTDGIEGNLVDDLVAGWEGVYRKIKSVRRQFGLGEMRVVFTELGYTFRRNSTIAPWDAEGFSLVPQAETSKLLVWSEQPIDYQERAIALRALRQVEQRSAHSVLAGILYWKLSTIDSHREIEPFVCLLGDSNDAALRRELVAFVN